LTYFEKQSTAEIGNSLQIDLVYFGSKAQTAEALVEVRRQRVATDNSQGLRITAKAILKKEGKLRLSIRNILATGLETFNHI
jgi:hypothetical protein